MTYATEIAKTEMGTFAEVFLIAVGLTNFFYISHDEDVTFSAQLYKAKSLKRGTITKTKDLTSKKLDIDIQLTEPATRFIANSPPEIISITITRFFIDDATAFKVIYKGEVISVGIKDGAAIMTCESRSILFRNKSPIVVHKATCNHQLFDSLCTLDRDLFKEEGIVTVSGSVS